MKKIEKQPEQMSAVSNAEGFTQSVRFCFRRTSGLNLDNAR